MQKAKLLNQQLLLEKLLQTLSQSGPASAKQLCEALDISQPTFSRLILQAQEAVFKINQGRQTIYARHRLGAWGKPKIPLIVINEKAQLTVAATLHPLAPKGFYLESHSPLFSSRIYENLPYFLEDLRPSGFLGRLVPRLHPELWLPEDISIWSDDDCLFYLTRYGWDLIGNLILGENPYNIHLDNRVTRLDVIPESNRELKYPEIAELVLSQGIAGSSAGGEQPKFLSIRKTQTEALIPVFVKFSPPLHDAISRRVADLLVCEHIAHGVLRKYGKKSPQSALIKGGERLFLEMERFDRNTPDGRLGILSLRALDLEFVGELKSWTSTAEALFHQKKIDEEVYQSIIWLEVFGKLIANTDRHPGNISFFSEGEKIIGLAPVYDMLPMMYAPQQNQLVARSFEPAPPKLLELPVWNEALKAARDFWIEVQKNDLISEGFKKMTADHEGKLTTLSQLHQ